MGAVIQCPICDGLAEDLPNTIDGKSVHCDRCGDFDVSGTVYDPGYLERLAPDERRQALQNAKQGARPGTRPMITTNCLGKIVFSGSSFQEVNRKADDWRVGNPDVKIMRRSGPMGTGFTGPSLNDMDSWIITIEYEPAARSNDER